MKKNGHNGIHRNRFECKRIMYFLIFRYFEKPEMKICKTVLISCKNSTVSSERLQIFTELNGELTDHTNQINLKNKDVNMT